MPIIEAPMRLPLKHRVSVMSVQRGRIDVADGACVVIDKHGVREQLPIGGITCLALEPGTRISHAAVRLAADVGCLLIWVGEGSVRCYSAGTLGGARSDRLLYQAKLCLDETARLAVVREMYAIRFGEPAPSRRSVDQLRGIEGARVRAIYKKLAKQFGVPWVRRRYDPAEWGAADDANRCLSTATSALYGVTEAAVHAAGYSPALGFLHTGKPLSFVFDIADLVKFETVVPLAFRVAASDSVDKERAVRHACRDVFRKSKLLARLVPMMDRVLAASGVEPPSALREGQIKPALPVDTREP